MKISVICIIGLCLALCIYCVYKFYYKNDTLANIEELIKKGAVILDVRTEDEYKEGHIKGAVNIPLNTLTDKELKLDVNSTYITYCAHGVRSVKAMNILKERGFKKVYNGDGYENMEKIMTNIKSE